MSPKYCKPVALLTALTLAACSADDTGDGSDGLGGAVAIEGTNTGNGVVTVALAALSSASDGASAGGPVVAPDADGTPLTLTRARAAVREVRFQLPEGLTCADLAEDAVEAPWRCDGADDWVKLTDGFVVDLLAPAPPASLADAPLPPLDWRRAEVRFQDGGDFAPAGDPLRELTLEAAGTFTYGGAEHAFTLGLDFSEDARFESPGDLGLPADDASGLLLALDAADWFAALPLTSCLDDGDLAFDASGSVNVTEGEGDCRHVEGDLRDAIEASGSLRRADGR